MGPPAMLRTTIAGSLPKPSWLADPAYQLFAPWVVPPERLREAQDDAVRLAVLDQERAGIDVVTDGEQRRRHYIWGFLDGLTGVDTRRTAKKRTRGDRYDTLQDVARVVGELGRPAPVMVDALRFTRSLTSRPVKVTLPGPMTIVDTTLDEFYHEDEKTMAMRWAALLGAEARDLAEAGADVIQFDEPCFNIYLDKVAAWGVEALERAVEGVTCVTAVHICYSYGIPRVLAWKSRNTEWGQYAETLPLIRHSSIRQVSVECAASRVDVSVLAAAAGKDVLLGVIDVGSEAVETPELVAQRIRAALPYVPPDRLVPCTDCGLVPRSRAAAVGKLSALAAGAALVRAELQSPRAAGR
ncbi:MAG: methionine synthase [Candidatus Rokubacteria bacterium]|nr:methionine synthase [Candidatus Rokubacteria bacterium]